MKYATIKISHCIQDMQNMSGNEDASVMSSRIFFTLERDGKEYSDLYVNISQPYGTNYEEEPVEVGPPVGYKGPFNHEKFSDFIEQYYRGLVGSQGSGIRIEGSSNVRMRNNTFRMKHVFDIEVPEASEGAW